RDFVWRMAQSLRATLADGGGSRGKEPVARPGQHLENPSSVCIYRLSGRDAPSHSRDRPMRFDKLTTKFQQALADAQSLAVRHDHPYIENAHLLSALLADPDSGAASLLARAGVAVPRLQAELDRQIKAMPTVQGAEGNIQAGRDLQAALEIGRA